MKQPFFLFLLVLLTACEPAQERTSYPLTVGGTLPEVENEKDFEIEFDEATATIGPVRFFEGEVLLSRRFSPLDLLVRSAWAHPGHYVPGESMGEWLEDATVDLLRAPQEVGTVEAVTGSYGSMELTLSSIWIKGTATKGELVIPFEVTLKHEAPLEGVRAHATVTTSTRGVTVLLNVQKWLQRVDFETAEEDDDGVFRFGPSTQGYNALFRAVADTGAYTVVFAPQEQ